MLKTVEEIRRLRLKMLLNEAGSFANLNRMTDKTATDATYSQICNAAPDSKTGKPREMGSALARSLEAKLNLERGLMDTDPDLSADAWPFPTIKKSDLLALNRQDIVRLEAALLAVAKQMGIKIGDSA